MLKNILLTSTLIAGFAITANASTEAAANGVSVKVGLHSNTQGGHAQQTRHFRNKTVAPDYYNYDDPSYHDKLHRSGLVNENELRINVDGVADQGFRYGAFINLNANTSDPNALKQKDVAASTATSLLASVSEKNIAKQTSVYVEGDMFGRLEAGSDAGATKKMQVNAMSFAATGAGSAKYWWNETARFDDVGTTDAGARVYTHQAFLTSPNLVTNDEGLVGVRGNNANKISYYSPKLAGFQLGVSYTPSTDHTGTVSALNSLTKSVKRSELKTNVWPASNVWEGALSYANQFDMVGVQASIAGQKGEAKKELVEHNQDSHRYQGLSAWEVGASVNIQNLTLGGSYGSHGKSLQRKDAAAPTTGSKTTKYWTAGLAYNYGPVGASVTYFESKKGFLLDKDTDADLYVNNKLREVTAAIDYKLAPGFMPYLAVTGFQFKNGDTGYFSKGNSGYVGLVGTKLHF